jgi:hypothetical protein
VFRANFLEASQEVEKMDYQAVNPCELDHSAHDQSWEGFMKVDLIALMDCECIYLMRGWGNSRGARLEYHLAQELGLDVMAADWDELLFNNYNQGVEHDYDEDIRQ